MQQNDWPLVTVVTPAYNQGIFLKETIESVLSQDYPNIEYIVLDDGSTDETPRILEEYNGRIRWESQKNMGQTSTINKGWRMTNGRIITWLNSDDTFLPGAVKAGVEYLLKHPETGIVFATCLMTEADGTPIGPSKTHPPFKYEKILVEWENPIPQPSAFIRREIIEKVGELDPKFYYFMDWDLWLRAGLYFKMDNIPGLWSTYRLHPDSKTVAQSKKSAPELAYMFDKFFSQADLPASVKKIKNKSKMNMYFTSAGYFMNGGDKKSAARMGWAALRAYPAGMFRYRNLYKFLYCIFGRPRNQPDSNTPIQH